jgi:protein-tyrosine-phosphatase
MLKKKILFVCSGNVFRSMSAKYCFEDFLNRKKIKNVVVDSAGISVTSKKSQKIALEVKKLLLEKGIDVSKHISKNVSTVDLKSYDLIVSMGYNHKKYLLEKYGVTSILFNKVCYGVNYPVYDNNEILKDYKGFRGTIYNQEIVKKIYSDIYFFNKQYECFI